MIAFSIRKMDIRDCPGCYDCTRRMTSTQDFCKNFCKINEEVLYNCIYCGKDGRFVGARYDMKPITCSHCGRDLSRLEEMGKQTGMDIRIGYHKGYSNA